MTEDITDTSTQYYYHSSASLHLESGKILPSYRIAYQTFGKLNRDKSNVVWIVHPLTANTNPLEWWSGIVGKGLAIDSDKHYIVCANALGSHYGSTNALDIDEQSQEKYYHNFPLLTNRDIINAFVCLRKHLEIPEISILIGSSIGGQQALEWSIIENQIVSQLVLIACNAKHSPYAIAFNESQRMSIAADQTWSDNRDDAGLRGLRAARAIALLSYRTAQGYSVTQPRNPEAYDNHSASSYQQYQGLKLSRRFNAFSYWSLSKAMDSHDVGRGRGSTRKALESVVAKTTVIGITTDILFPIQEQKELAKGIANASFVEISSLYGHDGFLIENEKMAQILRKVTEL